MQAIPRWRNLLLLKNSIIQSTLVASTSKSQLAEFHSTRTSHEKWENKWNYVSLFSRLLQLKRNPQFEKKRVPSFVVELKADGDILLMGRRPGRLLGILTPEFMFLHCGRQDVRGGQQPSKTYVKYKVRQKRADTKKALKDLLFNSGSSRFTFEEAVPAPDTSWYADQEDHFDKKDWSKSSHAARRNAKAQHRRMKRKSKEKLYEEMDSSDNVFQTTFRHRGCTWSNWSSRDFCYESSATGFERKEHPNRSYRKQRESDIESETESDDENCAEGMDSKRKLLGLPTRGPLKIEDVKKAFHLSALKWHPDKHQGPSQAMAEEKFKLCVDAYKSLCNSLSTA